MSEFFNGDAIQASRYWEAFQRLQNKEIEFACNLLRLKGDNLLVERLPKLEIGHKVEGTNKTIFIPGEIETYKDTAGDKMTNFGLVLRAGPGDVSSDGSRIEMEIEVGAVVLLPGNVEWFSVFGHLKHYKQYTIGRVREAQIPMDFRDYLTVFKELNNES